MLAPLLAVSVAMSGGSPLVILDYFVPCRNPDCNISSHFEKMGGSELSQIMRRIRQAYSTVVFLSGGPQSLLFLVRTVDPRIPIICDLYEGRSVDPIKSDRLRLINSAPSAHFRGVTCFLDNYKSGQVFLVISPHLENDGFKAQLLEYCLLRRIHFRSVRQGDQLGMVVGIVSPVAVLYLSHPETPAAICHLKNRYNRLGLVLLSAKGNFTLTERFCYENTISIDYYRPLPLPDVMFPQIANSTADKFKTLGIFLNTLRFSRVETALYGVVDGARVKADNAVLQRIVRHSLPFRVVVRVDEPFIMKIGLGEIGLCRAGVICLQIFPAASVDQSFADFTSAGELAGRLYDVYCCYGLLIQLLQEVTPHLPNLQVYMLTDPSYGVMVDGRWNGVIGELVEDRADLGVASLTISSERLQYVDFVSIRMSTVDSLISLRTARVMGTVFDPFRLDVWVLLASFVFVLVFTTAALEWLSPYGRRKERVYAIGGRPLTLGSALTTVISVLTMNSLQAKSPKSVSARFLQTFWAFSAFIVMAYYTAFLTAIISGDHDGQIDVRDILTNPSVQIGVLRGSVLSSTVPRNSAKFVEYRSNDQGFADLRSGKIHYILNEAIYAQIPRINPECDLRMDGQLGKTHYGFALPRGSVHQTTMQNTIDQLFRTSSLAVLVEKYFVAEYCEIVGVETTTITPRHHEASLVLLGTSILLCLLLCLGEHCGHKYAIGMLRMRAPGSIWKSSRMHFVSQKIYHSVMTPPDSPVYFRNHVGYLRVVGRAIQFTRRVSKLARSGEGSLEF